MKEIEHRKHFKIFNNKYKMNKIILKKSRKKSKRITQINELIVLVIQHPDVIIIMNLFIKVISLSVVKIVRWR